MPNEAIFSRCTSCSLRLFSSLIMVFKLATRDSNSSPLEIGGILL